MVDEKQKKNHSMDRDRDNLTYIHTTDSLWSPEGRRFQREKYLPRVELVRERFGDSFDTIRVLDVGVGYGVFLNLLENEFGLKNIFGMDPFPASIEIAKKYTSAEIVSGDINDERWPVPERSFDLITSFDVVEHLAQPAVFFDRAKDYLRPGGFIIVTTPNRQLPYLMRAIPWFGIPDTNTTHINVKRPGYWKRTAREAGYDIVKAWRGEHLTHTRIFPKLFRNICAALGADHRKIPIVNSFEQSFCMLLQHRQDL
ncbi:MAG: class I SAM-dependent methyltransferase [Candidatus Krumholzibacteria bacterium]|nr:class I SAM-dependent methyltransferase [Candidatus Krumholzibacteria bacterium]